MSRLFILAASLAAFSYLVYFSVETTLPYVENDIEERSIAALQFLGIHSIEISANGQTVTASGTVRNHQEQELILETVRSVWGVRGALDELKLFIPVPYELTLDSDGKRVLLSGYLSDDQQRKELHAALANYYGEGNINDTVEIAAGAPEKMYTAIMQNALPGLTALEYGSVIFRDQKLEINGVMRDGKSGEKIVSLLQKQLPANYKYELITDAAATETGEKVASADSPPEDSARNRIAFLDACQNQLNERLKSQKIEFNSGKATLTEASRPTLKAIAKALMDCPVKQITIIGHTDSQGAQAANLALSTKRADAVADTIEKLGLSRQLLRTKGLGESQPIAPNNTAAGRAQNRRIEIKLQ